MLKTHCEQRGFKCRHFLLLLFCFTIAFFELFSFGGQFKAVGMGTNENII